MLVYVLVGVILIVLSYIYLKYYWDHHFDVKKTKNKIQNKSHV